MTQALALIAPKPIRRRALKSAMLGVFHEYGFTVLISMVRQLESEIGVENREALARDGWVA